MKQRGFYRLKVEDRGNGEAAEMRRVLVLRVYRDGVEVEAIEFDLSPLGARSLLDEVRWLEWKAEQ